MNTTKSLLKILVTFLFISISNGQEIKVKWYDKITLGGYMQARNNDLYKTNPNMENPQGDRTYGGYSGFSLRRMRLKVSGQVHKRVYFYFQADFASDGKNLGQLRDAYFDYFIDEAGAFKLRGGQSKIPFGFENLQSSQNRIGLDRNDPLNSAVKDERDLNIGIHWAPVEKRALLKEIVNKGFKGTGDYGMAYIMMYNGQKANTLIPNVDKLNHIAFRFTYPIKLPSGQFIEAAVQGYTGKYVTTEVNDAVKLRDDNGNTTDIDAVNQQFRDQRLAVSFLYYPQPFGVQLEYNFGQGPEYKYDPTNVPSPHSIGVESLHGGYIQLMYMKRIKQQILTPFTRFMYYDGGKKFEQDARSYEVKELEIGAEWQINKAIEFTANYTIANRRYEDSFKPINREKGQLIRLQLQINY
ncbi:porin [Tamlana fucoidanivorans]|uniref:Porin n=1 Tax=Allotamlana fucoidanivorans TaxID=2583814 RepID=A0A5C4SRQ6_9FLAO|nr:porin [Tamlana fucoidanivorans]TNJ47100.1 porin [Tamlana fucoidanivorans]